MAIEDEHQRNDVEPPRAQRSDFDDPDESPEIAAADDSDDPDLSKRPVVAVVSLERTATQSVYHTLRHALDADTIVMHSHFVGETPWRQIHDAATKRKQKKELVVLRRLNVKVRRRIVFTIWRESLDRITSLLWYGHADLLRDRAYPYASDPKIQTTICVALDKQNKYYPLVYRRIGVRGVIKKGRNDLPSGVTLYVLRFSNLEADFQAACKDAFGQEFSLVRINTADQRSDADVDDYRSFARRFNLKDTLYLTLKERYGIERDTWAQDFDPGLLGLGEKWISVLAAAVTKEALES
jgi:hypothetical protein